MSSPAKKQIVMRYHGGGKGYVISEEEFISRTERQGYIRRGTGLKYLRQNKRLRIPNADFWLEDVKPPKDIKPKKAPPPAPPESEITGQLKFD
jgi:hypothetical protein